MTSGNSEVVLGVPADVAGALAWTDSLVVRPSVIHGLGVFARHAFAVGEIVERVPFIPIDTDEMHFARIPGTFMHRYLMPDVPTPGHSVWMTGFATLLNHATDGREPNVDWELAGERLMLFRAIRPIAPGEEITYDYGEDTGF